MIWDLFFLKFGFIIKLFPWRAGTCLPAGREQVTVFAGFLGIDLKVPSPVAQLVEQVTVEN